MKTICVAGKNDIAVNILLHLLKLNYNDYNIFKKRKVESI